MNRRQSSAFKHFKRVQETVQLSFPSRLDCVPVAVSYLSAIAVRLELVDPDESNFPVALDEALTNAVIHGNRKDEGKLVHVEAVFTLEKLQVVVRDEGHGFDFRSLPDPLQEDELQRTHGRGIFLMRALVDEVRFNQAGNEITLVLHRRGAKTPPKTHHRQMPTASAKSS